MGRTLCAGKSGIGPITPLGLLATTPSASAASAPTSTSPSTASTSARPSGSTASASSAWPRPSTRSRTPGIDFDKEDRYRCGVHHRQRHRRHRDASRSSTRSSSTAASRRVSPFTVPRLMANAASGNVSILFRINGPNTAVATACATGSNAIGDAGRFIQHDLADVMIAGGSEAALCELGMATLLRRPRPVDPQRRPRARQPPVGQGPRRLRHERRAPASSSSRSTSTPRSAAPRSTPSWSATA